MGWDGMGWDGMRITCHICSHHVSTNDDQVRDIAHRYGTKQAASDGGVDYQLPPELASLPTV